MDKIEICIAVVISNRALKRVASTCDHCNSEDPPRTTRVKYPEAEMNINAHKHQVTAEAVENSALGRCPV